MINNEVPTDSNILDSVFIDTAFLTQTPLRDHNSVLAYFSTTPFFNTNSNNYLLQRQNLPLSHEDLLGMVGREYVVDDSLSKGPHLWIVCERRRYSRERSEILQMFFILDGQVMRCTNLKEVLVTRCQKIAHAIHKVQQTIDL